MMKLNDLRNGMRVELRVSEPNKKYYILNDKIFETDETGYADMFCSLRCYDENLNNKEYSSSDIVAIYNAENIMIWARERNKYMPEKGEIVYRKIINDSNSKELKESIFLKKDGNGYLIYDLASNLTLNVKYMVVPRKSNIVKIEDTLYPFIRSEFEKITNPEDKYLLDGMTKGFSEHLVESMGIWLEDYAYEYKKDEEDRKQKQKEEESYESKELRPVKKTIRRPA